MGCGTPALVVKALKTFPSDSNLATNGCGAIYNLSSGSAEVKDKLMGIGAVEVVVKVGIELLLHTLSNHFAYPSPNFCTIYTHPHSFSDAH